MREAQKTVLELGLCSRLFESSDDDTIAPPRFIDQAVVVWRNATRITKTECSDYPNPRTVVQQKFGLLANRNSIPQTDDITQAPAHERARFNPRPASPIPYNREELLRWHANPALFEDRPGNPEEFVHHRMMTAGEVRAQMISEREANRRSGLRYPTPEEVSEIERRFRNPELEHAIDVARQEILRRYWPRNVLIDPEPPRWAQNPDGSLERVD